MDERLVKKPVKLIIDDDESITTHMKWALHQDYDVYLAVDGDKTMELLKSERPPLITLGIGIRQKMPFIPINCGRYRKILWRANSSGMRRARSLERMRKGPAGSSLPAAAHPSLMR